MKRTKFIALGIFILLFVAQPFHAEAQGTAFTYQGRIADNSGGITGLYDFRFQVFDAATSGSQVGATINPTAVVVSNGLFAVTLDFGANVFTGPARWLDIAAKTNGNVAPFISMTPRQPITPAPYAVTAGGLSGALPPGNFAGTYNNSVTLSNAANSFLGTYAGNGGNLTNLNVAAVGPSGLLSVAPQFVTPVTGSDLAQLATNLYQLAGGGFNAQIPIAVVVVDVNGDGFLDLLAATTNENTLTVMTNTGSGRFVFCTAISLSAPATSVSALNVPSTAGSPFVICTTTQGYQLFTSAGNGTLNSAGTGSYTPAAGKYLVSSALMSAGGFIVPALGDNRGNIYGPFGNTTNNIQPAGGAINVVSVFSTNGTFLTFAAADTLGNRVAILASPSDAPTYYSVGLAPAQISAADVNGDGFTDLITANAGGNSLTVLTNNGSQVFGLYATASNVGGTPVSVSAADLNGDGFVDLICANSNGLPNTLTILTNNGHGTFTSSATIEAFGTTDVITPDVNNDGLPDVAFNCTYSLFANSVGALPSIPRTLTLSGAAQMTNIFNQLGGTFTGIVHASGLSVSGATIATNSANIFNGTFTGTFNGAVNASTLSASGAVQLTNSANNLRGVFTGNGSSVSNLNASQLTTGLVPLSVLPVGLETNGSTLKVGTGGTVISRFEAGQAVMNIAITTGHTNFTFTFPQTFTTVPKVLVSPYNDPGFANVDDTFCLTIRTITTTTCTVNVYRIDGTNPWSQNLRINWQAWE